MEYFMNFILGSEYAAFTPEVLVRLFIFIMVCDVITSVSGMCLKVGDMS